MKESPVRYQPTDRDTDNRNESSNDRLRMGQYPVVKTPQQLRPETGLRYQP